MPAAPLTRGRLTALWHVLRTVEKLGGTPAATDVASYARRSSLRGGGLPVTDGMTLALEGKFLRESDQQLVLSGLGRTALGLGEEDEPSSAVLRLFLSVLLLEDPPPWVAWWQGDPDSLDDVIPRAQHELLREVAMLPVPDADDVGSWSWWQALGRVPMPERSSEAQKAVGDAGEVLTIEFERQRLRAEGHPGLADDVRWVAQESDAYGFDVLSFSGSEYGDDPSAPLAIEVKSTTLPVTALFRLFLSTHEWQMAKQLGERHVFYLWSRVEPGPPAASRQLAPLVFRADDLAEHIPGTAPCDGECGWQNARIFLPVTEEA